jgi:hypothetical protein
LYLFGRSELMKKNSIIDQITAHGAVAAHTTGRYVDIFNNVPVQVTLAQPIYMGKNKLRKGDKIAIIDTREGIAWICTVSVVESGLFSKTQVLGLERAKRIKLQD